MKIVKDDLPTEGVKINGIRFLPGVPENVDKELGDALIKRKGFKLVKGGSKNNTEVTENGEG